MTTSSYSQLPWWTEMSSQQVMDRNEQSVALMQRKYNQNQKSHGRFVKNYCTWQTFMQIMGLHHNASVNLQFLRKQDRFENFQSENHCSSLDLYFIS